MAYKRTLWLVATLAYAGYRKLVAPIKGICDEEHK